MPPSDVGEEVAQCQHHRLDSLALTAVTVAAVCIAAKMKADRSNVSKTFGFGFLCAHRLPGGLQYQILFVYDLYWPLKTFDSFTSF